MNEIVDAAWELSRANGLGNFSMRELGTRVGMRAQSLYSYFASKHEIYDAMFFQGNLSLIETMADVAAGADPEDDPAAAITEMVRSFVRFCTSDPTRYQLMFQRTIRDFVPSDESYAKAREAYEMAFAPLGGLDLDDADRDLFTAVMSGLVAQQISNDPDGDRWERLVPRATNMLLSELGSARSHR